VSAVAVVGDVDRNVVVVMEWDEELAELTECWSVGVGDGLVGRNRLIGDELFI